MIIRNGTNERLSDSVCFNGLVFLSGKLPSDLCDDINVQSISMLQVVDEALKRAGTSKSRLLSAQIFLKNSSDAPAFNDIWNAWLPQGCAPARICVQANMVNSACLAEISIVAAKE